jgi:hypothetical protein
VRGLLLSVFFHLCRLCMYSCVCVCAWVCVCVCVCACVCVCVCVCTFSLLFPSSSNTGGTTFTSVLQVCYKCVTSVLQVCYKCVTSVSPVCYKCATTVLQVYYKCAHQCEVGEVFIERSCLLIVESAPLGEVCVTGLSCVQCNDSVTLV